MIDLAEIRRQAAKWWPEVLQAVLKREDFFPKALVRIGKVKASERLRDFESIRARQDALIASSKQQTGYGYSLQWVERSYRNVGRNRFIDGITFDTLEDYLTFLRRNAAYERFLEDAQLIREKIPMLNDWCEEHPLLIEEYHGEWPALLDLVQYFQHHHRWEVHYIRELPVAVPTKFVETHKKILHFLLEAVLLPEQIDRSYSPSKQFEQRYGLRYQQPLLRLRLLDQAIAEAHFSGLNDLSIPLSDFQQLQLPIRRLIVLENKTNFNNLMNFLTLPELAATVGLFGSGFKIGLLKEVSWLHNVELYYWGDIDAHGLQILSQFRSYFPHVQSFLMDRATFDALPEYHTSSPLSTATTLEYLTAQEQALFNYLNNNQLRLEQERIPQEMVRVVVGGLLED
jgi:hypothetical protein